MGYIKNFIIFATEGAVPRIFIERSKEKSTRIIEMKNLEEKRERERERERGQQI